MIWIFSANHIYYWPSITIVCYINRWLFPFIGHMGICTSSGVIRDFAGPYYVSVSYTCYFYIYFLWLNWWYYRILLVIILGRQHGIWKSYSVIAGYLNSVFSLYYVGFVGRLYKIVLHVNRYWQLPLDKLGLINSREVWDRSVYEASEEYKGHMVSYIR